MRTHRPLLTSQAQSAPPPISFRRRLARLREDETAQDMVEYALIAVAMGLFTVAGIHGLAASIQNDIITILNAFNAATGIYQ